MTKNVIPGPNDTAVEGVTSVSEVMPPINNLDLVKIVDDPGTTVYLDATSPVDQPSMIRYTVRDVANIYSGTSIDPRAYLATRKGRDMVVNVSEVHRVDDSTDASFVQFYPISVTITLKAPVDSVVSSTVLTRMIGRAYAAIAKNGDDGIAAGLAALHRGSTSR